MSEEKKDKTVTAVAKKEATAVARETTNIARIKGSWRERLERMLPEPAMIDQFMYCAEVQYGENRLAFEKCTPVSLLSCLMTCAKFGILPDGRNAYLIPYGDECTLQFDYKGLVHVVIRDDVAKKVHAEVVCANDKFCWENGKVKYHEISLPRGQLLGAYCIITLSNGEEQHELLDLDDIESIKACSRGANSPSSPWNKFYKEMAKKSAFRRCTKWIKLSPDIMDAIAHDDEGGYTFDTAKSAKASVKSLFVKPDEPEKVVDEKEEETIDVETITVEQKIAEKEKAQEAEREKSGLPF